VYAFRQNDAPNPNTGTAASDRWLADVAANAGCKCVHVATPQPHKDANDWTRAGATPEDIQDAIANAVPVATAVADGSALLSNAPKPAIVLPEDAGSDEIQAPFPVDCLPPSMANMVKAVATSQLVPESLPGAMVLAQMGASIGKGLVLDWRPGKAPTPANLFVVVSAASGTGKSECSKILFQPFLDFERNMQELWRKEVMPKLQADLRYHEGQLKKLDRKLGKESISQEDVEHFRAEMVSHQKQVDELKFKLHEPQLSIQDATVEKVSTVMYHNDETVFSVSADARKLTDNLLGRYSANKKLADDGIYLSAFSGDYVKVDRQSREGITLENPIMSLLWALQPDAMELLLDEDSLQQGGFLARSLLVPTNAEPQYIGGLTPPIAGDVRASWDNLIHSMLKQYRQPATLPASASTPVKQMIDEEF
jgi:hypothetical protein